MIKEETTTKVIIDVDVVINEYNEKNPDKRKMDREQLAEILGCGKQLLSDWKSNKKKAPKWAKQVLQLSEIAGMDPRNFIKEIKLDGRTNDI